MFSHTINKHELFNSKYFNSLSKVSCDLESKWIYGPKFMNHLKMNDFIGLSDQVKFHKQSGLRSELKLSIVDKNKHSIDLLST